MFIYIISVLEREAGVCSNTNPFYLFGFDLGEISLVKYPSGVRMKGGIRKESHHYGHRDIKYYDPKTNKVYFFDGDSYRDTDGNYYSFYGEFNVSDMDRIRNELQGYDYIILDVERRDANFLDEFAPEKKTGFYVLRVFSNKPFGI